jgi:hypothetical protein
VRESSKKKTGRVSKENKVIKKANIILEVEVELRDENSQMPYNNSHFLTALKNHIKGCCNEGIVANNSISHSKKQSGKSKEESTKTYDIKHKVLVKSVRPSLTNQVRKRKRK